MEHRDSERIIQAIPAHGWLAVYHHKDKFRDVDIGTECSFEAIVAFALIENHSEGPWLTDMNGNKVPERSLVPVVSTVEGFLEIEHAANFVGCCRDTIEDRELWEKRIHDVYFKEDDNRKKA